jgi:predicted amidophosphoribosyltransferase
VWEIKYYANPHALRLCGHILGERLFDLASEELGTPLLIPIPMHPKRRNERGHNQTELLCEAALTYIEKPEIMKKMVWPAIGSGRDGRSENLFGRISGFEYAPNILIKQKQTPQQQGLPEHVRRKNILHTILVSDVKKAKDRVCVVLDDVTTTGATFEEAARALLAADARKVIAIALAHS